MHLAIDALRRGLLTTITTFNLQLFDPTWFEHQSESYFRQFLIDKLAGQLEAKKQDALVDWHRMESSTQAYTQYLKLGGRIRMSPLDERLIARPLSKGIPILCGLSATYLYQEARERPILDPAFSDEPICVTAESGEMPSSVSDDIAGYPTGHFVVLRGFDPSSGEVEIADPLHQNPFSDSNHYRASFTTLTTALLLGIVTYDANLLAIVPSGRTL